MLSTYNAHNLLSWREATVRNWAPLFTPTHLLSTTNPPSRLKSTWEKLPGKYQRLFSEMQQLMDPSRNMSR